MRTRSMQSRVIIIIGRPNYWKIKLFLKYLYDSSTLTEAGQCLLQLQLKFLSGTSNQIMSKHVTETLAALVTLMSFRRMGSVEL